MKVRLLLVLSVIILVLATAVALASSFSGSMIPTTVDAGVGNKFFNLTVTNNGPGNITRVNVTLPTNFKFVTNSNGTSASNWKFSIKTGTQPVLSWYNTTATGIIDNGATQYFWFNISVPKAISGKYYFNITIVNTTKKANSTLLQIYVRSTVWSSNGTFYVKRAETYLNWTKKTAAGNYTQNITIIANASKPKKLNITILNKLSAPPYFSYLKPYYTQTTGGERSCSNIGLSAMNSTGSYNSSYVATINGTTPNNNATSVALAVSYPTDWKACHPGRYSTSTFTVRNDNLADEANVTVYIDIPILPSNSTGVGNFNGQLPANASKYHSFFFNASNSKSARFANATSVFINVSAAYDVDVFLFDNNGVLRGKAINKTAGSEIIRYNYMKPSDNMWEIRIFGNSSASSISYTGKIILTGLNVTNISQQTAFLVNFGTMSETSNKTLAVKITNNANSTMSGVTESKELYLIKRFSGGSAANYSVLLPLSSIKKLKVTLNWTGAANYSLDVYNPTGSLVMKSAGKHKYANVSRATQEEYNETTSLGSVSGVWRIEVLNKSKYLNQYNLTVYGYVDSSTWLKTNITKYSSSLYFNRSGKNNSTYSLHVNLSVPSNARNGIYEGRLRYLDSRNAGVEVPLRVNVTSPVLAVNNTMYSGDYRLDENYGVNLTRIMYFNITNFGDVPFYINFTNSTNLTGGSYKATLIHNKTTEPLNAGSSSIIQVNISFNSSMPARTYTGWIKVNATNQSSLATAKSYSLYTIYLTLNLTNLLKVHVSARSENGTFVINSTPQKNITILVDVYFINGSGPITDLEGMSNFTGAWLQETNITSPLGRIPNSGSLSMYNGTDDPQAPYCTGACPLGGNHYFINASVPQNNVGGRYKAYVNVSYKKKSFTYRGTGYSLKNETLVIDDVGLYMKAMNSTSITIPNGTSYYFYANISNYGPVKGDDAVINITKPSNCGGYTVIKETYGCPGWSVNPTGVKFMFDPPKYNTGCYVVWKITAGSAAADECISRVLGDGSSNRWFNPNGINITVRVTAPTTTTTIAPGGLPPGTRATYRMNLSFTKAESVISVAQNSSNTTIVTVKNTGNKTHPFNFTITELNSAWYKINSTNASLPVNRKASFLVNFTVGIVDIKDYAGKFKAYSPNTTITSDFVIRVLPAPQKETEIANIITLYRVNMTKVWSSINESRDEGVNTTAAESKIVEAKEKIKLAESYITQGKYFEAYQLLNEIKSLIAGAETALSASIKAHEESKAPMWVYWVIGIVIGGVAVLGYLLWPEPGYSPKTKTYTYKTPKHIAKDKWSEFRRKLGSTVFGKPYTSSTVPTKPVSYKELKLKYGKKPIVKQRIRPSAPIFAPTGKFSIKLKEEPLPTKIGSEFNKVSKKVSKFFDNLSKKRKPWKKYS